MMLCKQGGCFVPWAEPDAEEFAALTAGAVYRATLKAQEARHLEHHRLYWTGLLGLALDYWEPISGLLSPVESALLDRFASYVEREGNAPEALQEPLKAFKDLVRSKRSEQIDSPSKTVDALHRWIKEELGYYEVDVTPAGIRKVLKSISFQRMDQAEFEKFYKEAFGLIWRMVLNKVYKSESDLDNAIVVRLSQMG